MPDYTYKGSGTNSQGNHYCARDYGSSASNSNSYHYSNSQVYPHARIRMSLTAGFRDGSYYYSNPNGSTYYNDGAGSSTYTSPSGYSTTQSGDGGKK